MRPSPHRVAVRRLKAVVLHDQYVTTDYYNHPKMVRLSETLNRLKFPLTVYRGLRLRPGDNINPNRIHGHWTWNRKVAVRFAKGSNPSAQRFRGDPVLLEGVIRSPADIDWKSTIDLNIEFPNEQEIVGTVSHAREVERGDQMRYVTGSTATFYRPLHSRSKGLFYRGARRAGAGGGSDLGALGKGLYVTWSIPMAEFFASRSGGQVYVYKLPSNLKLLDAQSDEMAGIKAEMGLPLEGYSDNPMYAPLLTTLVQELGKGYDGVISDNMADGLVLFDPRKAKLLGLQTDQE